MNKNQRFIRAVDYLIGKKHVKDAKTLCEITGLSESTISNIRREKKAVSLKSVCKLSDAFPGMFNPEYFQGVSEYLLLEETKQKAVDLSIDKPTANIIELYASLIQDIEKIRQQVKQELAEVQALKHEYLTARDDFRKAITLLHPALNYEIPNDQPRMAAENTEKQ